MKVVVFGSGGQARVVAEILLHDKTKQLIGFVDPFTKNTKEKIFELPILGGYEVIPSLIKKGVKGFVIGVGDNKIREKRFNELKKRGLEPITAIHPTANIAKEVKIGKGAVVAIGATIATKAIIGENVIINSGAIIEHDNVIEDHVHVAPGAALAGRVKVKSRALIGLRSVVKEFLTIGGKSIVGAGSVVVKDVPDNVVVVGVPAKKLRENDK